MSESYVYNSCSELNSEFVFVLLGLPKNRKFGCIETFGFWGLKPKEKLIFGLSLGI